MRIYIVLVGELYNYSLPEIVTTDQQFMLDSLPQAFAATTDLLAIEVWEDNQKIGSYEFDYYGHINSNSQVSRDKVYDELVKEVTEFLQSLN
ncbi:hypothetical protein [Paenibacillus daejeonensis]|uniref:hypothetical protein n=1 Tax=Paenibacillus daejeonensis TaxID=135193 RepID=UPI00037BC890|nr:hypothetical protein [Paenibacillus daejeonensis]